MRVLLPKKGYSINPMRDFPRNDACPCKSDKKFKKCCYQKQPLFIDSTVAEGLEIAMKQYKSKQVNR